MIVTDFFIRKVSIAITIFGILLFIGFSEIIQPKEFKIESISEKTVGSQIIVKGIVKNTHISKNTILFEVFDPDKIKAIKFSPTATEIDLISNSTFLELKGTIKTYKGELEIIVDSVKKID